MSTTKPSHATDTLDDKSKDLESLKDQEDNILVKDDKVQETAVSKDNDSGEVLREPTGSDLVSKDEDSGEVSKPASSETVAGKSVVETTETKPQKRETSPAKDLKTDTSGTDKTASEIISITDKVIDVDKSIKGEPCSIGECVLEKCERCVTPSIDADKKISSSDSVAGPSKSDGLSPSKGEEGDLSGKSTPDIADVEKEEEIQETLKHEKHIPGCSTPPTVPASPIIKEAFHEELKTDKKSSDVAAIVAIKEDVRSSTPGSDDNEYGMTSTHSDISLGQMSRAPNLLESEHHENDEDLGSPLSVTSQIAHSPNYEFEERPPKGDPMNASFYGDEDSGFKSGRFLDDSDLDFEKAMQEHRQTRGEDLEGGPSTHLYEVTTAKFAKIGETKDEANLMTSSFIGTELPGQSKDKAKDPIESWGKPLGLPSPAPPSDNKGTPKKERKLPPNVTAKNKLNDDRKRSESPSKKQKKLTPVYVDLTYVPHHGNANYSYVDFFNRVRARYYVFSGIEPSKEVYNALLEAKQTWEDKDLEVTIIPTYDTDVLGYWVTENEDLLTKCKIDLSPSASCCTINLQYHETSCSAYRLEF